MNLTLDKRCYTYYLERNRETIRRQAYDSKTSLEDYKNKVFETISPANLTPKKFYFKDMVKDMPTKKAIWMYIYNSINKAKSYNPANRGN